MAEISRLRRCLRSATHTQGQTCVLHARLRTVDCDGDTDSGTDSDTDSSYNVGTEGNSLLSGLLEGIEESVLGLGTR